MLQALFDHIPVGVGSQGIIPTTAKDLEETLEMGMDWSLREASTPSQPSQPARGRLQMQNAFGMCSSMQASALLLLLPAQPSPAPPSVSLPPACLPACLPAGLLVG